MSTDVDALDLLPAEESEEDKARWVTGCDLFTFCTDTTC
jgi:hypothetical protein